MPGVDVRIRPFPEPGEIGFRIAAWSAGLDHLKSNCDGQFEWKPVQPEFMDVTKNFGAKMLLEEPTLLRPGIISSRHHFFPKSLMLTKPNLTYETIKRDKMVPG